MDWGEKKNSNCVYNRFLRSLNLNVNEENENFVDEIFHLVKFPRQFNRELMYQL